MNIVVRRDFDYAEWVQICSWLIDNFERVKAHDAEKTPVDLNRLRVWRLWDGDQAVAAHFSLEGDDDLVLWFRMKYL